MLNTNVVVRAKFLNYKFRNRGFCVVRLRVLEITPSDPLNPPLSRLDGLNGEITAVGNLPDLNIDTETEVVLSGTWENSKYGPQLNIKSLIISDPTDINGILNYLSSGAIRGIGPVLASRIVDYFGVDTLKILDENPNRLLEVKGIGNKNVGAIVSSWQSERAVSKLLVAICSFGLSIKYAKKVLDRFGDEAIKVIQNNPYQLAEIHGIGFLKADSIARKVGVPEDSPLRIYAAQLYCLTKSAFSEGHCYLPYNEMVSNVASLTGLDEDKVASLLSTEGEIKVVENKFYLKSIYEAEQYVSTKLSQIINGNERLPAIDVQSDFLTQEQMEALKHILFNQFSVLTGGPGTGKTTVLKFLVDILEKVGVSFCLVAPTGKAAKRLSEVTGYTVMTIHRLLEYNTERFARNQNNPLTYKFVIVDEASMIDILLMKAFLEAIPNDSFIVLSGDVDQLPSVGPGNVLRDIIRLKPDCLCRLNTIHRQAEGSNIIHAAHMVNHGRPVRYISEGEDLVFIHEDDPVKIRDAVVSLVCSNPYFKPEEIQVLTPQKKGSIGAKELNVVIRDALKEYNVNYVTTIAKDIVDFQFLGEERLVQEMEIFSGFRPGDRVIQLKNNYKKEVFNGEIGYVIDGDVDERVIRVLFDDRVLSYFDYELDELSLAYALTVHKSQGSEFPAVVFVIHTQHYVMLYRNLLYTAISRAKKMLAIVGSQKAFNIALRNNSLIKRFTNLYIA